MGAVTQGQKYARGSQKSIQPLVHSKVDLYKSKMKISSSSNIHSAISGSRREDFNSVKRFSNKMVNSHIEGQTRLNLEENQRNGENNSQFGNPNQQFFESKVENLKVHSSIRKDQDNGYRNDNDGDRQEYEIQYRKSQKRISSSKWDRANDRRPVSLRTIPEDLLNVRDQGYDQIKYAVKKLPIRSKLDLSIN